MGQTCAEYLGTKFNSVNAWDFLNDSIDQTAIGPRYADVPCGIAMPSSSRNFGYRGQTSRRAYKQTPRDYHTRHPYHP